MDTPTLIATIAVCLFGSGGIVIWILNRHARKADGRDENAKALEAIDKRLGTMQDGLVMTLENDRVIFKALRTHEINGESEEQERKMDRYFISLLEDKGDRK
jgi:uncharacterized membrane protein